MEQGLRAQSLGGASSAAPPMPDNKAFSQYRAPSPVSPYLNLFRSDSNGTVDNYSTLVKPQLDQMNLNSQFGRDIHGLNANTQMQGLTIRQLQSRTLQGVSTPQFMNYGSYFQNPYQSQ